MFKNINFIIFHFCWTNISSRLLALVLSVQFPSGVAFDVFFKPGAGRLKRKAHHTASDTLSHYFYKVLWKCAFQSKMFFNILSTFCSAAQILSQSLVKPSIKDGVESTKWSFSVSEYNNTAYCYRSLSKSSVTTVLYIEVRNVQIRLLTC